MSQFTESIAERVAALDPYEFKSWAETAAAQLHNHGCAFVRLEPGDATSYKISIVQPLLPKWGVVSEVDDAGVITTTQVGTFERQSKYWLACSFGPLYEWSGRKGFNDPGYVQEKWVYGDSPTSEHTAHVIARFLDALAEAMIKEDE